MAESMDIVDIKGHFTYFDGAFSVLAIIAVFIDHFTDIFVVLEYFYLGYPAWAVSSLLLILIPSIIVLMFSIRWYLQDEPKNREKHFIIYACSMGLLYRYFCVMKLGLKSRRTKNPDDYHRYLAAQNDLSLLHLFESFLESAPQLVLQLYVTACLQELRLLTCLSASASVFSLSLSLVAYSRAQRRARLPQVAPSWFALLMQTLWRLGMLTARIAALVILLLVFQAWFLLFIGVHWASMFVWIVYQKTDLCELKWEERCYNAVAAVIYCFCFFNLKDGHSRWRLLSYYSLIIFQNLTCLTVFLMFYRERTSKIGAVAFTAILAGTVIGTVNMALYYRFFHPSGPIDFCIEAGGCSPPAQNNTLRSLKHSDGARVLSLSSSPPSSGDKKLVLTDSIVIEEESDMEDISTLQKWIHEASNNEKKRHGVTSPCVELYEGASSEMSAHDYENLPAVNIARDGKIRTWHGYCDINTCVHDDSVGKDGHTITSSTTTSQDYLESIADDYVDCKTASSLHTILEESQSTCSDTIPIPLDACTLVATIDQIRTGTPLSDPERRPPVRRTFSLLRERFELPRDSQAEPPPPTAPWAPRDAPSPSRFISVKDMRDFFLKQLLTPPKINALRRKMSASPAIV